MTGAPRRAFQIVVAATKNWGIGLRGGLPFELPGAWGPGSGLVGILVMHHMCWLAQRGRSSAVVAWLAGTAGHQQQQQ
jgi:hypothetical protein